MRPKISQLDVHLMRLPSYGTMSACYVTPTLVSMEKHKHGQECSRGISKIQLHLMIDTNFGARSLMNGLIDQAIKKEVLFRADNETVRDGSEERYGLVQCSRDINRSACSNCFRLLMDAADFCCESKLGWHILSPSCNIRYENYSFFQQEPAMSSPTGIRSLPPEPQSPNLVPSPTGIQSLPPELSSPNLVASPTGIRSGNGKTCRF